MSKRWVDYFEKTVADKNLLEYAVDHWNYNAQLYYQIKKAVSPPAGILEVGCGYGLSSIYLQECGYHVTAVDNDMEIVNLAKKSAEILNSNFMIEQADAFDLHRYYGIFDLCFSVGVIEHFPIETTIKLLREQKQCARYVIAVVPSKYTKYTGKITDERIYDLSQLKQIFRGAGLADVSVFGYGDIPAKLYTFIRYCLPFGVYRILQNYFSYAMSLGCVGKSVLFKQQ